MNNLTDSDPQASSFLQGSGYDNPHGTVHKMVVFDPVKDLIINIDMGHFSTCSLR